MRFITKTSFFSLFLFVFESSCKNAKVDADCGCGGSTYATIENLPARHSGKGYFVINRIEANGNLTYGWACDVDSTWNVSTDEKIWNYTISGNLKKRCPVAGQEYMSMMPGGPIQITSIKNNN